MMLTNNQLHRVKKRDNYSKLILDSNPYFYYRLNELSGNTFADSSSNSITGTLNGSVTLNQSSLLVNSPSDKSVLFSGNGYIRQQNPGISVSAFTIECLFKTSGNGGLIWCANSDVINAGGDKALFIENGQLKLFIYPGYNAVLFNSSLYHNDNNVHIATGTCGSRGFELWIDKILVNSAPIYNSQFYMPTYWRIGHARWFGGDGYFNGFIDEISINHAQISQAEIELRHTHAGF